MQIVELNTMKVAEESKRILLEGYVTQLRDENPKLKNNIKLLEQREADCDIAQFKNEFVSFKNASDIQDLKSTLRTPSKNRTTCPFLKAALLKVTLFPLFLERDLIARLCLTMFNLLQLISKLALTPRIGKGRLT